MDLIFLIGRIIVGLFYLYNANNHFKNFGAVTAYAASKGVPAPKLAVLVTGTLLLLGSLSIITGFQPLIGIILVIIFFLPVTFAMHNFWAVKDPMQKVSDQINFQKNMALMGSALRFLAIPTPWPYSLGG